MVSHHLGHGEEGIRVHYVPRNVAHHGSRQVHADRGDVDLVRGHNSEHNHGEEAFHWVFRHVQGKRLDGQGCCLAADLKQSMENEGPNRSEFDGRTRLR